MIKIAGTFLKRIQVEVVLDYYPYCSSNLQYTTTTSYWKYLDLSFVCPFITLFLKKCILLLLLLLLVKYLVSDSSFYLKSDGHLR